MVQIVHSYLLCQCPDTNWFVKWFESKQGSMRHISYFSSFPGFFSLTLGHVITPEAFLQDCSLTEEPEIPHSTDSSLRSHSCPWITRPSKTFHKAVKSKPGQKESKGSRHAQGFDSWQIISGQYLHKQLKMHVIDFSQMQNCTLTSKKLA